MNKRMLASLAVLLAMGLSFPTGSSAQLISLKTVPVASGDQFLIFPSDNLAMGGVSIALDDLRLDPFVNPAKGAWLTEPQVFSVPTFYSISNSAGSAQTLPFGATLNSQDGWFGGAFGALQNLRRSDLFFGPVPLPGIIDNVPVPNSLSSQSATNKYANLNFGRRVGSDLAIGGRVFVADLSALDGIEHLYATASAIGQEGDITDLRLGLSKKFVGDRNFEAVLLHNRFNMTHDVAYVDFVFDPVTRAPQQQPRLETNLDQTRTWGAHLGYDQPVGETGWRVGGILTANRKNHPKIPNYEIMNIPRDPGHSNAFDVGIGFSKQTEHTTFGLDIIYEPASSETWAEAEGPVVTSLGDTIPKGGKTVENSFDFSNAFVNMGVSHDVDAISLQLGLRVAAYDFHLDQVNNVADTFRRQDEDWMEWTPSWGLSARFSDFELRYSGRATTGTGRPGIALTRFAEDRLASAGATPNDVLLAPEGPLTLQDATVLTHQFTISIPIR